MVLVKVGVTTVESSKLNKSQSEFQVHNWISACRWWGKKKRH